MAKCPGRSTTKRHVSLSANAHSGKHFPPYLVVECTRVIRPEVMSDKKSAKKWQEKLDKQSEKSEEKKRKREAAFVPPKVRFSFCVFIYVSVGFSFSCRVTKSCYLFQENTAGLSESVKSTNDNEIADITKSLKVHSRCCFVSVLLNLFWHLISVF